MKTFNVNDIIARAQLRRREQLPRSNQYTAAEKAALQDKPITLAQLSALEGFGEEYIGKFSDLTQWEAQVKLEEMTDHRRQNPDEYMATPTQIMTLIEKFGTDPADIEGATFGQASALMDAWIAKIRSRENTIARPTDVAPPARRAPAKKVAATRKAR